MPYIKSNRRQDVEFNVDIRNAGELNYYITKALCNYLIWNGVTYQKINDCIGALEAAKLELYRRVVIPYEDKKIKENGDVYTEDL